MRSEQVLRRLGSGAAWPCCCEVKRNGAHTHSLFLARGEGSSWASGISSPGPWHSRWLGHLEQKEVTGTSVQRCPCKIPLPTIMVMGPFPLPSLPTLPLHPLVVPASGHGHLPPGKHQRRSACYAGPDKSGGESTGAQQDGWAGSPGKFPHSNVPGKTVSLCPPLHMLLHWGTWPGFSPQIHSA